MTITYLDYKIEPCDNAVGKFDLSRKGVSKKRDSEEIYEIEVNMGYAYTLESAIQKIIYLEIEKKNETLTLKEYLNEFRKMKDEILNELKEVLTVKIN